MLCVLAQFQQFRSIYGVVTRTYLHPQVRILLNQLMMHYYVITLYRYYYYFRGQVNANRVVFTVHPVVGGAY